MSTTIIAPNAFDSLIDRMLTVVTLWRLQPYTER